MKMLMKKCIKYDVCCKVKKDVQHQRHITYKKWFHNLSNCKGGCAVGIAVM